MAEKARRGWKFAQSAVVLAVVIGALVALLYPAVQAARRAAWRSQRINNLKQIGLALQNFDDIYHGLPPAVRRDEDGRPLCSWRLQIVPFLEAMMQGLDFTDRWDAPANRWLLALHRDIYCYGPPRGQRLKGKLDTYIVAIAGEGTAFDGDRVRRLSDLDPDTILAIEVADSGVRWAEPGDLDISDMAPSVTGGVAGDGIAVLFADGAVWFLHAEVPFEDLKKFCTIEGARKHDREQLLAAYVDGK